MTTPIHTPTSAGLAETDARLKLRLGPSLGQPAAMSAGFVFSQGELIVPFDGDLQSDPADTAPLAGGGSRLDESERVCEVLRGLDAVAVGFRTSSAGCCSSGGGCAGRN